MYFGDRRGPVRTVTGRGSCKCTRHPPSMRVLARSGKLGSTRYAVATSCGMTQLPRSAAPQRPSGASFSPPSRIIATAATRCGRQSGCESIALTNVSGVDTDPRHSRTNSTASPARPPKSSNSKYGGPRSGLGQLNACSKGPYSDGRVMGAAFRRLPRAGSASVVCQGGGLPSRISHRSLIES